MLNTGDIAPDFELIDQDGATVTLKELLQHGELVLYFYPADFTPVCTKEACAFRDVYPDLEQVSVQVAGVSPQGPESHRRFAEAFNLPFRLLCDEEKVAIKAYGVDGLLGFSVRRTTFLIGQDRRIMNRVTADLSVDSHMELIESVLAGESGG